MEKHHQRIFIDGGEGTTGLQIHERLKPLIESEKIRMVFTRGFAKDPEERRKAMNQSDLAVLCLPDDAAKESVEIASSLGAGAPKILDASTAHRLEWVYGFPEMEQEQIEKIRNADTVANPGCYATGAIALIRPLVSAGVIPEDYPVTINAVSGYSGGGKQMIRAHAEGTAQNFELYGLALKHKHVPEIQKYSSLTKRPLFVPSVGKFYQGMLVSVPLHLKELPTQPSVRDIAAALEKHYAGSARIRVVSHAGDESRRLDAAEFANTDSLGLHVYGDDEVGHALLVASLDNLGKGAAGAAVQNIELVLGLDRTSEK